MSDNEIVFDVLLRPYGDQRLRARLNAVLREVAAPEVISELRQIDGNIGKPGGAVFHWHDAIGLGEALDALEQVGGLSLAPDALTKALTAMLKMWTKIRSVRVEITGPEFVVMRALKRGNTTVNAIAAFTGFSVADIAATLEGLGKKTYGKDEPLVKKSGDSYITSF